MPGGGGATETQSMEPWGPAKNALKDLYGRALDLSQTEMPYYAGDTTAGMSADTARAYDMARALSGSNLGATLTPTLTELATDTGAFWSTPEGARAWSALDPVLAGNPFATPALTSDPGATAIAGLSDTAAGTAARPYGQIGDWSWGASPEGRAMTAGLLDTASGSYLDPASNPSWNAFATAAADTVKRATDARYLGAGQTLDNPSVAQTFSRDFASVMAPYAAQMYDAERARQEAARGQIGGLLQSGASLNEGGYQTEAQRRLSAASALAEVGQTGTAQALQAAAELGDLYGQGTQTQLASLGLAPSIGQLSYLPANMLEGIGKGAESYTQTDLNDALMRYQYGLMEPWQRLQLLQQLVSPSAYGTQTSSGGASGSPLAATLGGGLTGAASGAAIGGALGGATAGSVVPGIGTAIGAGVGALGGWLASRR